MTKEQLQELYNAAIKEESELMLSNYKTFEELVNLPLSEESMQIIQQNCNFRMKILKLNPDNNSNLQGETAVLVKIYTAYTFGIEKGSCSCQ